MYIEYDLTWTAETKIFMTEIDIHWSIAVVEVCGPEHQDEYHS